MKWLRRFEFGLLFSIFLGIAVQGRAADSLGVGVTTSPSVGQPNSNLTFAISVTNLTPFDMSLSITDALPASFVFLPQPGSGWVATGNGNEITFFTNSFVSGAFFT